MDKIFSTVGPLFLFLIAVIGRPQSPSPRQGQEVIQNTAEGTTQSSVISSVDVLANAENDATVSGGFTMTSDATAAIVIPNNGLISGGMGSSVGTITGDAYGSLSYPESYAQGFTETSTNLTGSAASLQTLTTKNKGHSHVLERLNKLTKQQLITSPNTDETVATGTFTGISSSEGTTFNPISFSTSTTSHISGSSGSNGVGAAINGANPSAGSGSADSDINLHTSVPVSGMTATNFGGATLAEGTGAIVSVVSSG